MKKLSKIIVVILIFTLTIGFSNNIAIAEEDPMAVFYEPWKQYQESAKTGDANLLKTIVETMIYATEWKDIPAETKTSYINFLSQLASNSILSLTENETFLAAIKSRLETIRQSALTEEQKTAASGVKKQVDEMQKIVNKAYEEEYGTGEEYKIYKSPDKDEEEELNREIDTSIDAIDEAVEGADTFIEEGSNNQINEEKLQDTFSYIYNIFLGIGIGISVIVAIILAIKFMIAGIDEKAEVKKMFFIYVIACIIIFGGFGIWKIVVNIIGDASTTSEVVEVEDNEQNDGQSQDDGSSGESGLESKDNGKEEENILANFIRLNYTNLKINMNRVKLLKLDAVAVAKKIELAAEKISWKSSDENIATVNDRGLVTFKEEGTVKITATLESNPTITRTCTIQVVKIVMKSIKITPPNYDKAVLMLDKSHYNFTILDTKVEPKNAKVKYTSSNENVAEVNSKGCIVAKSYGTTTITATGTINGTSKSAKCEVRVIATKADPSKDSGKYVYRGEAFYIRNYNPSKGRIDPDKSGSWSKEEVESYINNGEWILKNYGKARASKYKESRAATYYWFGKPYNAYSANKKEGDISPTDWILLFTSKNQWVYVLHRGSDGKWKQEVAMQASGGYYWGPRFDAYLGSDEAAYGGRTFAIYYDQQEGVNKYRIL